MATLRLIARLDQLLAVLGEGVFDVDAPRLAARMGVSRRTVLRDLATLRAIGYEIRFDTARRTFVLESPPRRPLRSLTRLEMAGIACCRTGVPPQSIRRRMGIDIEGAIERIAASAALTGRDDWRAALDSVHYLPSEPADHSDQSDICRRILLASMMQQNIRLYFVDLESAGTESTLWSPHGLVISDTRIVTVGRSSWHRRCGAIPLDQISRTEATDETFIRPVQWMTRPYARREIVPVSCRRLRPAR